MSKDAFKKTYKIIKGIVNVIVTLLVVAFLIIVCMQRFSDNRLSFFNYRMFNVITGSMEPRYKIGDVLIAKEVDAKDVKVGDTISYLGAEGHFKDKVITHEVVEIEKEENGKLIFHTKGLVNIVEDPLVREDQLYGVVKYKSKILSFVYKIVDTTVGMFVFVVVPILYIIGSEIIAVMLEKTEKKRAKKEEPTEE